MGMEGATTLRPLAGHLSELVSVSAIASGKDIRVTVQQSQRALVLTPWFPERPGGRYLYILDQIEALVAEGVEVDVVILRPWFPSWMRFFRAHQTRDVAPPMCSASDFELQVVRSVVLPRSVLPAVRGPLSLASASPRLRTQLTKRCYTVIHAHTEAGGYIATRIGRRYNIPTVITLHGIDPGESYLTNGTCHTQFGETLARAARVVLVGSPLLGYFERLAVRGGKFEVILNGYSLPVGLKPSVRFARRRRIRLVSVSNLCANKGVDITLRALAQLARDGVADIEYVIVGDGPERASLAALARELTLEDRTHFTGELSHPEAMAEVAAGDVFCLPSWREACGIVYMEAMALGKIVIGCEAQGPSQFIRHGTTGYLVEPKSVQSLAKTLARATADLSRPEGVGYAAAQFAQKNLTWPVNAKRMVRLFEELCVA